MERNILSLYGHLEPWAEKAYLARMLSQEAKGQVEVHAMSCSNCARQVGLFKSAPARASGVNYCNIPGLSEDKKWALSIIRPLPE